MKIWFSNAIPYGWLLCNGQSCASYSNLANFLGKNTVPDLRGEFLRGAGTNSHNGQGNGASIGQHQDGTIIPYLETNLNNGLYALGMGHRSENPSYMDSEYYNNSDQMWMDKNASGIAGEAHVTAYTTRPTNTSVNYIIKW